MGSEESVGNAIRIGASIWLLAGLWSCAVPIGGDSTPNEPPAFNHISEPQLELAMWQLAAGINELDAIFGRHGPISQAQRLETLEILERMRAAADELGPDGVSTNHPRITRHLGRFRDVLRIAQEAVAMEPPRYYLVGALSGSCLACHAGQ